MQCAITCVINNTYNISNNYEDILCVCRVEKLMKRKFIFFASLRGENWKWNVTHNLLSWVSGRQRGKGRQGTERPRPKYPPPICCVYFYSAIHFDTHSHTHYSWADIEARLKVTYAWYTVYVLGEVLRVRQLTAGTCIRSFVLCVFYNTDRGKFQRESRKA